MDFDKFMSEGLIDTTPDIDVSEDKSTSTPSSLMSSPNLLTENYVVIDEKTFKPGYLFSALHKGCTTLSMKHGKGIKIIRRGDWIVLQLIDAGCGLQVQHQSAPFDSKKAKASNTAKIDVKGQTGVKKAWGPK